MQNGKTIKTRKNVDFNVDIFKMIQKKKLWMIENGFWGMMIAKEVDVCADYRK